MDYLFLRDDLKPKTINYKEIVHSEILFEFGIVISDKRFKTSIFCITKTRMHNCFYLFNKLHIVFFSIIFSYFIRSNDLTCVGLKI